MWDRIEQRKAIKLKLDGTNSERLKEKRRVEYKGGEANTQGQEELVRRDRKRSRRNSKNATHEDLTKMICNDKPRQSTVVNDKNGNALTSNEHRKKRWSEHFYGDTQ